jgi:hypothetical protein
MEYFIGSVLTLATVSVCNILLFKNKNKNKKVSLEVQFRQSRLHELLKPVEAIRYLVEAIGKPPTPTQSRKHQASQHVKVVMSETEAYWVANNIFYVADVKDNLIVQETTREVDTMVMDEVQLKKIIEIVEMLGDINDSSGPRGKGI